MLFRSYALIISYAIFFWFGFILNGWYSFKLIGYGIWGQVKDAFPILLYAICIAGIAMLVGFILPDFHPLLRLTLQFLAIIPAAIFAGRISGLAAYRQLIELVKEQYVQFRHKI